MSLPRRGFVKSGVLSAISAGIIIRNPALLLGQSLKVEETSGIAQEDPVLFFNQTTFESFVGDVFTATNARGEQVALELVRVTGYQVRAQTKIMMREISQPHTFSLTFNASEELPPFTSIHKMNHPRLGNFDLFLSGSKKDDGTFSYVAVISHL